MKAIIKNLSDLEKFVIDFLLEKKQKKHATIIALSGDLGAGKTAFVKCAGKFFNIKDDITSPTFVIQKEYEIHGDSIFKKMIHIDAYRLKNKDELEYLKWQDSISNSENIIFIEWPEQVVGIDLPNAEHFFISLDKNQNRIIENKKQA